jgi:hypothetical protein
MRISYELYNDLAEDLGNPLGALEVYRIILAALKSGQEVILVGDPEFEEPDRKLQVNGRGEIVVAPV